MIQTLLQKTVYKIDKSCFIKFIYRVLLIVPLIKIIILQKNKLLLFFNSLKPKHEKIIIIYNVTLKLNVR